MSGADAPVPGSTTPSAEPSDGRPHSREAHEVGLDGEDDGFDSEEFRQWMRDRNSRRRPPRRSYRDESDSDYRGDGRSGDRASSGPPPEWDGETPFQNYVVKARLWLATTKAPPASRGPLLLQRLTKNPFDTMKYLAKDPMWMKSKDNGPQLIDLMDQADMFGEDRDEDQLSALARITFHLRREKGENYRQFFTKWDNAMRKVNEHNIQLPDRYIGFLLINALVLSDSDIKSMMNYTRGSISSRDIREWVRKLETKLQTSQLGNDNKDKKASSSSSTTTKTSGNYLTVEDATDNDYEDDEIFALEEAIKDLHGGSDSLSGIGDDENQTLEEHEVAEILSTMLAKKKTYVQSIKNKKTKELARGYGGKGKSTFTATGTGRFPKSKDGKMFRMSLEEIDQLKKITKCGFCKKVGHWHKECPEKGAKEQNLLETEEASFCGLLEASPGEEELSATDREQFRASEDGTAVGTFETCFDYEPNHEEMYIARPDMTYHEVLFGETKSGSMLVTDKHHDLDVGDDGCATIDTGCQRMAVGATTLDKMINLLPEQLQVKKIPQEHRFRSVNGRTTTKHVASIPTSIGSKGGILRPAVFEEETSRNAPFLISLPFLMACRTTLVLDPEEGLQAHFKQLGCSVPCHVGPTGALRIPLCNFQKQQLDHLREVQGRDSKGQEFEIFRTSSQPVDSLAQKPQLERDQDPRATTCHGDLQQAKPSRTFEGGLDVEGVDEEDLLHHPQHKSHGSQAHDPLGEGYSSTGSPKPNPKDQGRDGLHDTAGDTKILCTEPVKSQLLGDIGLQDIGQQLGRTRDDHSKGAEEGRPSTTMQPRRVLQALRDPVQGPNFLKLFWRCPRARARQCQFFMWTRDQPIIEDMKMSKETPMGRKMGPKELAQLQCKHLETTKAGSNAFRRIERCKECGLLLVDEKTDLAHKKDMAKEIEKHKKLNEPTYQDFLEWKRQGAMEKRGVWSTQNQLQPYSRQEKNDR